jgi:glucose/arabinose dehydrogenase
MARTGLTGHLLALALAAGARSSRAAAVENGGTLVSSTTESGVTLDVPEGYRLSVAAEGLRRVRFFTPAPDGRLFVTGLDSLSDNERGKIYVLADPDPDTGRFDQVTVWLDGLRNPNSLAFFTDAVGSAWIYVALTDELRRYRYRAGELAPSSAPETLARFPGYGLGYKYGGWHLTRSLSVGAVDGAPTLFVSVGSSCNLCEERDDEPERAAVLAMPLPEGEPRPFARGLRNAVGLHWIDGRLVATNMGADHLGPDRPQDHLYVVEDGGDYGWPYCYEHEGTVFPESPADQSYDRKLDAAKTSWRRAPRDCSRVVRATASFPAHSSPLGFARVPDDFADEGIRGELLVALHGPTVVRDLSAARRAGYRIVRARPGSEREPETFVGGFLRGETIQGRPCDVFIASDRDILFTDDHRGVVYRLTYRRDPAQEDAAIPTSALPSGRDRKPSAPEYRSRAARSPRGRTILPRR